MKGPNLFLLTPLTKTRPLEDNREIIIKTGQIIDKTRAGLVFQLFNQEMRKCPAEGVDRPLRLHGILAKPKLS